MNAAVVALLSLAAFWLATRFYARWIERRVYAMDNDDPTPAHVQGDGVDFVPCHKHVLFGHHFCSVAGAAPIVGPAIAVIWGWVPALLWVVLGTIFIGAVHDFGALALSAKRGGRTMGDLAAEIVSPRARTCFLSIIVLLTWVVLAVFAYLIAVLFQLFPASVWPVNVEILFAVVLGWWVYKRQGSMLWGSIAAVVLLYAFIFLSVQHPEWGDLSLVFGEEGARMAWIFFLLGYAFIASVLPVRVLLQPRDFINSHQLLIGLVGLILGILWVRPEIVAPAFNDQAAAAGAPDLLPLLFITIACGAISGFHGLVASGTTSKQLDCMRDARTVGYGGMVGEGVLAMIAVLAVSAGFESTQIWHERYGDWETVGRSGIGNFVAGAATFVADILGGNLALAKTVIAVIVISFAATTLDTAARIQRFCVGELGASWGLPVLKNRYVGSLVAIVPAALLALTDGGRGPGSGGFILWPIFGTTNQLIGGITLILLVIHLKRTRRPIWPLAIPMVFLVVITTVAGVRNLAAELGRDPLNVPVVVFGGLFLLLEAAILWEVVRHMSRRRADGAPVPTKD